MVRNIFAVLVALLSVLACADRVGIVVQYSGSSYETVCVEFSGSATAEDALRMSGLGLDIYDDPTYGAGLCGINGVGCPASDCWCGGSDYWAFYHRTGGSWQYASVGISGLNVHDGMMIGFRWGPYGSPIEDKRFAEVCPDPNLPPAPAPKNEEKPPGLELAADRNDSCGNVTFAVTGNAGTAVPFAQVRVVKKGGLLRYGEVLGATADVDGKAGFALEPGIYLAQAMMPQYLPYEKVIEVHECPALAEEVLPAPFPVFVPAEVGVPFEVPAEVEEIVAISAPLLNVVAGWDATGWADTGWAGPWMRR